MIEPTDTARPEVRSAAADRRPGPLRAGLAVGLIVCMAACGSSSEREAPQGGTPERNSTEELLPVELPPLEQLDEAVGLRLVELHDELERLRAADADAARLAEAYGSLGMHLHAQGLFEAARPAYLDAHRLASADARWICSLAPLERRRNDLAAAARAYEACLELQPDYVAGQTRLGEVRLELGEAAAARRAFERALELDANAAAAMVGLGTLESRARNHERALEWYERALGLVPEANNLHFHIATALRALGDLDGAERHMRQRGEIKVGVSDPLIEELGRLAGGTRSLTDQGQQLARAGRNAEARALFEQALAEAPDDGVANLYLGLVLIRLDLLDEAQARLERAIELMPDDERAHLHVARIRVAAGDDAAALASFREVVRIHPGKAIGRLELARQLRRVGDPAAALEQYEQAVDLDPGNAEARLGLALSRVRLGRWVEARDGLERDIAALPDEPVFPHALARVLAAAPDAAVRDGARALTLAQELSKTMQNLDLAETIGMALAESGRFEEAASWQRQLIDLARQAGAEDRVSRLNGNLSRYESRNACRLPWTADDPIFALPRPGASRALSDDAPADGVESGKSG